MIIFILIFFRLKRKPSNNSSNNNLHNITNIQVSHITLALAAQQAYFMAKIRGIPKKQNLVKSLLAEIVNK